MVGGLCPAVLQPPSCTNMPPVPLSVSRHRFPRTHADAGVTDHRAAPSTFGAGEPRSQRLDKARTRGWREKRVAKFVLPFVCVWGAAEHCE